jgi:hypothetical protein
MQVRSSWLLGLRLAMLLPLAYYYYGRGLSYPLLQAACLITVSLASSIRKDISMRRSFLNLRQLAWREVSHGPNRACKE